MMNELVKVSDLGELAHAINREHDLARQTFKTALHHAIKAGELLRKARAKVGHGAWLPWLQENCHISERTAQAYMRLAREFPKLDSAKAQRVADLPLRTALQEIAQERREEIWDPDELSEIIKYVNEKFFADNTKHQIDLDPEPLYRLFFKHDDGTMTEREKIGFCLQMNYGTRLCFWVNFAKAKGKESLPPEILRYLDEVYGDLPSIKICHEHCGRPWTLDEGSGLSAPH
jgi:hypothetical protein